MDLKVETIHISQYFYVLIKRVWLIILCFVLILVFTIYLTYRTTPIYQSNASVYVGQGTIKGVDILENLYNQDVTNQDQIFIIKSDPIANMIIDALNLEKRFSSKMDVNKEFSTREDIVEWLKEAIEVVPEDKSQILTISATGEDPQLITDIINSACDQFIIYNMESRMQNMRRTLQWHTEQLEDLKDKVRKSKEVLITFIEDNKVTFLRTPSPDTSDVRNNAKNPLLELNSIKLEISLERDRLLQRYTNEHPKVKALNEQIAMIQNRIYEQESKLTEANKTFIRYEMLRADAGSDEELYNTFLRKFKEINIADTVTGSNVQVLEYAKIPKKPIAPDKVKNYFLGVLFGILGGIGMAFVVEYFDDAPKSAAEIEAYVNLPIVATLPKLKRNKDRSIDLIVAKHPKSTEAEVMRMLRTYILFEKENPEDKVLMITSSGPKEGKSSISSNLAVSMSQANVRTLLIDADLRRPILHRLFNLEKEIGLADLLLGRSTLDRVIKKTDVKNLYVMTCGTKVPNPTELLNSQSMKKMMLKLRGIFGQIIIDTPPSGNLADSLVISSLADSAILVYSGEINKNLLLQTKRMLEKTTVKLYGIVLNNFNTSMRGYFDSYYNKYYNRYYQTYFHEEGEDDQEMV